MIEFMNALQSAIDLPLLLSALIVVSVRAGGSLAILTLFSSTSLPTFLRAIPLNIFAP
jgi:hypothetical protein